MKQNKEEKQQLTKSQDKIKKEKQLAETYGSFSPLMISTYVILVFNQIVEYSSKSDYSLIYSGHNFGYFGALLVTKPLVLFIMAINLFRYIKSSKKNGKYIYFVLCAECASIFGDVFMQFAEIQLSCFLAGIFSFFLAQTMYTSSSIQNIFYCPSQKKGYSTVIKLVTFFMLAFYLALIYIMKQRIPETPLFIGFVIYSSTIIGMFLSMLYRINSTSKISYYQMCFGAIIFIISDFLLCIKIFLQLGWNEDLIVVWVTYYIAQMLFQRGAINHQEFIEEMNCLQKKED